MPVKNSAPRKAPARQSIQSGEEVKASAPFNPPHFFKNPSEHHFNLTVVVAIIVLASLVLWNFGSSLLSFSSWSKRTDLATPGIVVDQSVYDQLLNPNAEASRKLLEQVITEDDVVKLADEILQTGQTVAPITVAKSEVKQIAKNDPETVKSYVAAYKAVIDSFDLKDAIESTTILSGQATIKELKALIDKETNARLALTKISVPSDAVDYHLLSLASLDNITQVTKAALDYEMGNIDSPWPDVHKFYTRFYDQDQEISQKYAYLYTTYLAHAPEQAPQPSALQSIFGTKIAQAQFGGATVIVGNPWQEIKDAALSALVDTMESFTTNLTDSVIQKIVGNFTIANYLYYNDSLIAGQYSDDYLNKYVKNQIDKEIVKRFIPQLACGDESVKAIQTVLKARAKSYAQNAGVGNINYNDPAFEVRMGSLGAKGTPEYWQQWAEGLASTATSEAQKAANQEINNPTGLKNPRGGGVATALGGMGDITKPVSTIAAAQISLYIRSIPAVQNVKSPKTAYGKIIKTVVQNLYENFLFKGSVYKEQRTCAVLSDVAPLIPKAIEELKTPSE